jgi:TolA-binding protein
MPLRFWKYLFLWLAFFPAAVAQAQVGGDYLSVLALEKSGSTEVSEAYEAVAGTNAPLADHALYKLLEHSFELDNFEQVIGFGNDFVERFPFSRFTGETRFWVAEAAIETGDFSLAQKVLTFDRDTLTQSNTARFLTLSAKILAGQKKYLQAQELLGEVTYLYAPFKWSIKAQVESDDLNEKSLAPHVIPSQEYVASMIDTSFAKRQFATCRRLTRVYTNLYPGDDSW